MATSRQTSKASSASKDFAEKSEVEALIKKIASLEKLCASLQSECAALRAEAKSAPSAPAQPAGSQAVDALANRLANCERKLARLLPKR